MNTSGLTTSGNATSTISAWFEQQLANLSPAGVALAMGFAFIVGLIIAFVYKRCYRGVLYSPSFAVTLVMMTLVTTRWSCASAPTWPCPWAWWARCPSCVSVRR